MKKRLESFEAKKLDTNQMYSVLGGIAVSASTTDSKGGLTRSTGADDDSKTSDGDADFADISDRDLSPANPGFNG